MGMAAWVLVAVAATPLWGRQESAPVDREWIEWFKKLPPEKKRMLRERLEEFRKLPPEERQRLRQNLKDWKQLPAEKRHELRREAERLAPEERERIIRVARSYFQHEGKRPPAGFPRELFFAWLKRERGARMHEMAQMEPSKRREAFRAALDDFRRQAQRRVEEHARRHRCVPEEQARRLAELGDAEFWPALQELRKACPRQPPPREPQRRPPPRK